MQPRLARRDALLGLLATLAGCAGGGLLTATPSPDRRAGRPLATATSGLPQTPMVALKSTGATPPFSTALTGAPTTTEPANGALLQSGADGPYVNLYKPDGTFVLQRDFALTGPNGMPYFRVTTSDGQSVAALMPDVSRVTPGSQLSLGDGYTLSMDAAGVTTIGNGTNTCTCSVDPTTSVATITRNGSQLPTVKLNQYPAFAGLFPAAGASSGASSLRHGLQQQTVPANPGGGSGGVTVSPCLAYLIALMALLTNLELITDGLIGCLEMIWPPAVASCMAVLAIMELVLLALIIYMMNQLKHCNDPTGTPAPHPIATAVAS